MTPRSIESLKRAAKKLKKERGITHTEALKEIAHREGFQKWELLVAAVEQK